MKYGLKNVGKIYLSIYIENLSSCAENGLNIQLCGLVDPAGAFCMKKLIKYLNEVKKILKLGMVP